jgi:hypothetical protein
MRLSAAMTLRDGGTTSITVTHWFARRVSYTVDYSLPWDGRMRYVYKGRPFQKDVSQRLELGGDEEKRVHQWLMEAATRKFSKTVVQNFLVGNARNPAKGRWFYALNFLRILANERKWVTR